MNDLVIIGGGPAGVAAGVYASRKQLKTVFIAKEFGGQSSVSEDVQNWIGTKSVSGFDFAKMLEEHLKAQGGIDIEEGERVMNLRRTATPGAIAEYLVNPDHMKYVNQLTIRHRQILSTVKGKVSFKIPR